MISSSPARIGWAMIWGYFMRNAKYDDALAISELSLLYAVENGEKEFQLELKDAVKKALEEISTSRDQVSIQSGLEACSFCGLSPPMVKLGAGPGVRICNQCVSDFSETFNSEKT